MKYEVKNKINGNQIKLMIAEILNKPMNNVETLLFNRFGYTNAAKLVELYLNGEIDKFIDFGVWEIDFIYIKNRLEELEKKYTKSTFSEIQKFGKSRRYNARLSGYITNDRMCEEYVSDRMIGKIETSNIIAIIDFEEGLLRNQDQVEAKLAEIEKRLILFENEEYSEFVKYEEHDKYYENKKEEIKMRY